MLDANGQTAADFLERITSRGSDLHPPAAPPGERYALSREERAGTHRISRLLIERTIPAICIGLCRFCNVIAPSRGRITRIQCRQVGMSSATDKETCNRNDRARNQAALQQRTPCNHSIHIHGPLGNNVPDPSAINGARPIKSMSMPTLNVCTLSNISNREISFFRGPTSPPRARSRSPTSSCRALARAPELVSAGPGSQLSQPPRHRPEWPPFRLRSYGASNQRSGWEKYHDGGPLGNCHSRLHRFL